jgi:hypothetical protein
MELVYGWFCMRCARWYTFYMHIKSQDKVILISAFAIGIFAGAYLFLMGYAPVFGSSKVPSQPAMTKFTIESDSYGGSGEGIPPSFQILSDGTYRYIPQTDAMATSAIAGLKQGNIPDSLMKSLRKKLTTTNLTLASRAVTPNQCASMAGGFDYHYRISVSGAEFTLDTCSTALTPDSDAGIVLQQVWEYLTSKAGSPAE